jgi:hypothetical protein
MSVKYQGSLNGRSRKWTIQLLKDGSTLVSDDHDVSLDTGLQYGQKMITGFLDLLVIPASLSVSFTDPGAVIWEDIRSSDPFSFTLRILDSEEEHGIDMYVKLADTFTTNNEDQQIPLTRLKAFCGLVRLKEIPVNQDFSVRLLNNAIQQMLVETLRSQDVLYKFDWRCARTSSTAPFVNSLRFEDLNFDYVGTDQDPDEAEMMGDFMTDICEAFQATVFNDFHHGRRWQFAQPWLNGLNLSLASRKAALYDVSADSIDEVEHTGQLVRLVTDDDTKRAIFEPDFSAEVSCYRKLDSVTNILIDRGSFDEGWITSSDNAFWVQSSPNILNQTIEGAYIDDGGHDIQNNMLLVKGGKWVRVQLNFDWALEYTPAGAGTHALEFRLIAVPINTATANQYGTDATVPETWTTTVTTIATSTVTPDANGTAPGSLTWRNEIYTLADYMPFDGYLVMQVLGDTGTDFFAHLRNVQGILEDQAASSTTDTPPWPARIVSSDIGGIVTAGNAVEMTRMFSPVIIERTTEFLQMQVDIGVLSYEEINSWETDIVGLEGPYWDLNELMLRVRLKRGSMQGRLLMGRHYGILTPGMALQAFGTRFLIVYLNIDLHTETTEYLIYENFVSTALT